MNRYLQLYIALFIYNVTRQGSQLCDYYDGVFVVILDLKYTQQIG